jgi:hypothetical protein
MMKEAKIIAPKIDINLFIIKIFISYS